MIGLRTRLLPHVLKKLSPNREVTNLILASVIGVLAGYGALVFKYLIKAMQWVFFQNTGDFLEFADQVPWFMKILLPTVGGLVVGVIIHFFAREAKGHGVPEVMQAIALRAGHIRKRVAFAKIMASAVTIGSGGSVGREGPMVQIGSSIGSSLGQVFHVPTADMRTMVGCGAAAGIAATFNAPIAGVLFALEIIIGDFGLMSFSPVVLSSVTATTISRYYFGDFPFFEIPGYAVVTHWEYLFYLVLGVVSGLSGFFFTTVLYWFEDFFEGLKIPGWAKPALGAGLLGVMIIWVPEVFGVGYGTMNMTLAGKLGFGVLFGLIFFKILATSLVLGGGGSGGIFAPSLFIGAVTGGAFGALIHGWFPTITAGPGAYALVAMGGVVAGTTYAPITAILIIFELTNTYTIILPLMLTCILATFMNSSMRKGSIYTIKLLRRGIDISGGRESTILKNIKVASVMDQTYHSVPEGATLETILEMFKMENAPYLHVLNKQGELTGIISFRDIRPLLHEEGLLFLIIAKDIATEQPLTVTPQDTLDEASRIFGEQGVSQLPVVSAEGGGKMIGTLTERAVTAAYNQAIVRRQIVEKTEEQGE